MNSFEENFGEAAFYQGVAATCAVAKPPAGCVPVLGIVAGLPLEEGESAVRKNLQNYSHTIPLLRGIRSHPGE